MAGDKNISQLGAKTLAFHPNDLIILRDFQSNRDVKVTYAQLLEALGSGNGLSAYEVAVLEGFVGTEAEWLESLTGESAYEIAVANGFVGTESEWLLTLKGDQGDPGEPGPPGEQGEQGEPGPPGGITGFPAADDKLYGIKNQLPYEIVGVSAEAREIATDLLITSATAGTITTQWFDHDGETNLVTAQALTFIGAPSTGNFRYDWIIGNDDGTVSVVSGTEGAEGAAFPPGISGTQVGLRLVLWNDGGAAEVSPPGQSTSGDFSTARLQTAVAPNTTGKYAKVWEGNLSKDAHFSLELSYDEPKNASAPYPGSGQRNLKVSFTCNASRNIISETVQIETDGGTAGEFVLYQISGNKAALYHKSNHYWGRIQFRAVFTNSQVRTQDLVNNAAYGSAPGSPVGTWASEVKEGGGTGGGLELIPFSTVINMTGNYKSVHTQTAAIAITKGSFPTPETNFENKTVQLIEANGVHGKPTFTSDFVVQMDTWSNNTGDINQLIYKGSPSGKILVWMDNVELA